MKKKANVTSTTLLNEYPKKRGDMMRKKAVKKAARQLNARSKINDKYATNNHPKIALNRWRKAYTSLKFRDLVKA